MNPQLSSTQWDVVPEKGEELAMSAESPCELRQPEPSPFSAKRTMYETEEVSHPEVRCTPGLGCPPPQPSWGLGPSWEGMRVPGALAREDA